MPCTTWFRIWLTRRGSPSTPARSRSSSGRLTFDGLTYGSIYALVAMGYTLVYGVLQLINFAHSEVFIVGVYASVFSLQALASGPRRSTRR